MSTNNALLYRFPHVLKVEASAGSGKTYALAKRYLQLLIGPHLSPAEVPLHEILAITFTNKAAQEMKERILELLKRIALDAFRTPQEKEVLLACLAVKEDAARSKARLIMEEIIRNYNYFQVATIDSFINAILSACAFKLDLSSSFKTEPAYEDYLAYSLDRLIDRAASDTDIARLFHDFLSHYLFIENKSGWFPRQDIAAIAAALFSKSNRFAGEFSASPVKTKDLIARKKRVLRLLEELNDCLPEETHKTFRDSLSSFVAANREGFDVDRLSDYFKREELPVKKGARLSRKTQALWDKIRAELGEVCEMESACAFNQYVEIFNLARLQLREMASRDDILFLEALNKEARSLFDEKSLTLPELYYRLATRFKHFLIDEFQDTSSLQWENLRTMVEEALSTDGSLFIVGDRKQAIYRFRGGEVSLMDEVAAGYRHLNLIEETLDMNYRSRQNIVLFTNEIFSQGNLRRFLAGSVAKEPVTKLTSQDIDVIAKVFDCCQQRYLHSKTGGYIKTCLLEAQDREGLDARVKETVYSIIEDASRRFALKDIAILARTNDEVGLLTGWCLEKGIAVESEKTLDIRQNPYLKELVSLLKFLNSPIDNLSFASFILGEVFLRSSGLARRQVEDFIFSWSNSPAQRESDYLYRAFREEFAVSWDGLLEGFFRSVGYAPLYELTVSIFAQFRVLEHFPSSQGFFMRFLELIREQEEEHPTISAFLEFFDAAPSEELYATITEGDAIKILTIHKAKGLEFAVVIVPFLEMNVRPDQQMVVSSGHSLKLAYLKKKYADFSAALALLMKEEYVRAFIDELNAVYVAFTRAAEELYVCVCRSKGRETLALGLIPELGRELGSRSCGRTPSDADKTPSIEVPPAEYRDWVGLLKEEFIRQHTLQSRASIIRGEALHRILSFIGNLHVCDEEAVVSAAIAKAGLRSAGGQDFLEYGSLVRELIRQPSLRGYFCVPDARVYTEQEVVDRHGNTRRIDRLIVLPKELVVVDYKSSREAASDSRQQVRDYMGILKDAYPAFTVRGALVYLDEQTSEEVGWTG